MEFVQLQINYADLENPAIQSKACYEVARKHGKPVIIMEPVKGGMLANPPEKVKEVLKSIPLIPCTTCNYCAKVCPQHIHIRNELEKVAKTFAEN